MFSDEDVEKINSYLHKNFDIIFDFEFNGLMLLFGGAVKDLIMGTDICDLDFVLLTQEKHNIREFFDKNSIEYKPNKYKGYSFIYNNIKIDMSVTNDLFYAGNLNTDMLFYDVKGKQIIPIGIKNAIDNNKIVVYYYAGYFKIKKRIKKAKKFINYMNKSNKEPTIKYNYILFFKLIVAFFKSPQKILKIFDEGKMYVK